MQKKILTFFTLLAAAIPVVALAAFTRPSQALSLLSYDGKPRTFSAEAYVRAEDMAATIAASGAMEGRRPKDVKAKLTLTANIAEGGAWLATVTVQARVYREKLYLLLEDIAAREGEAVPQEGVGQWYVLPLTLPDMRQAEQWEDVADELVVHLHEAGVETTAEELMQALISVVDGLFTMDHMQYVGGHAYSMRLHPAFLRNAVETVNRFLSEHGNEEVHAFAEEVQQGPMMEPDTLAATESQVQQMVNLHLKVDTNPGGAFVFGKYYVSLIPPGGDLGFAFQGKVQRQMTPVYLEVPRGAVPVGKRAGDMPELLRGFLNSASQTFGFTWFAPPAVEEEGLPAGEDLREEEEPVPAPQSPRVLRPLETNTRQRRRPMMPKVPGCNSQPGTREYVRMQRDGVCPAVNWQYAR